MLIIYGLILGIVKFYGPLFATVFLLITGSRKLSARDPSGWFFIVLGTIWPGLLLATFIYLSRAPDLRQAEVASWERMGAPTPTPRTLIIEINDSLLGFHHNAALRLAESGLFDVYLARHSRYLNNHNKTYPDRISYAKIHVDRWEDCAKRRTGNNDFVTRTGNLLCGKLISVSEVPTHGLVLYVGHDIAPLGTTPIFTKETLVDWTFQLEFHNESGQSLIAYDENITYPRFHFLPAFGFYLVEGDYPRRYLTSSSFTRDTGKLDDFVFKALGIDPAKIAIPSTQTPDELAERLNKLVLSGKKEHAIDALHQIGIYPETDPQLASLVEHIAADPNVSSKLWHPISCPELEGLKRYRNAMIRGCTVNPSSDTIPCGTLGDPHSWFQICTDKRSPIWPERNSNEIRVLIGGPPIRPQTNIAINGVRASLVTVEIPPDQGRLDVVIQARNYTANGYTIWKFEGALQCLGQLTVIGGDSAVVGVPADRIEFRYRLFATLNYHQGKALPNGILQELLGATPDFTITGQTEPRIDLGKFFSGLNVTDQRNCPSADTAKSISASSSEHTISPYDLVTVPTVIPRQIP